MNKNKRWIMAALLIAAWVFALAIVRTLLAPSIGAATVAQMNASNTSFIASMGFMSAASLLTMVVTIVFGVLLYLVIRAK